MTVILTCKVRFSPPLRWEHNISNIHTQIIFTSLPSPQFITSLWHQLLGHMWSQWCHCDVTSTRSLWRRGELTPMWGVWCEVTVNVKSLWAHCDISGISLWYQTCRVRCFEFTMRSLWYHCDVRMWYHSCELFVTSPFIRAPRNHVMTWFLFPSSLLPPLPPSSPARKYSWFNHASVKSFVQWSMETCWVQWYVVVATC